MKKLTSMFIAIFVATTLIGCGGADKSSDNSESSLMEKATEMAGLKSYMMKAIASIEDEGTKVTHNMTIWHDVAKEKMATEIEMTISAPGFSQTSKMLNIEDGETTYVINLGDNTGFKMTFKDDEDDFLDYKIEENESTLKQMIEADGGRVIGTETFLGRNCLVVETVEDDYDHGKVTTKMWLYKGMPLKMVSDKMTMEVTHLEENVNIPAERFKVPAGVTMR